MNIGRYLRPEQVKLELATCPDPEVEESVRAGDRYRWSQKQGVIEEVCALLCASNKAGNPRRLLTDLINREKKATTGIGHGVAIPHVRSMNVKEMVVAFARSSAGVEFLAVDGEPVHLILAIVAPPYDDSLYLKIYREMAQMFLDQEVVRGIREAEDEHEIIRIFRSMP